MHFSGEERRTGEKYNTSEGGLGTGWGLCGHHMCWVHRLATTTYRHLAWDTSLPHQYCYSQSRCSPENVMDWRMFAGWRVDSGKSTVGVGGEEGKEPGNLLSHDASLSSSRPLPSPCLCSLPPHFTTTHLTSAAPVLLHTARRSPAWSVAHRHSDG